MPTSEAYQVQVKIKINSGGQKSQRTLKIVVKQSMCLLPILKTQI